MEQITKEKLIEIFLTQIGSNKILGNFLSVEQIEQKLQNDIKYISFNHSENIAHCHYTKQGELSVNFDLDKMNKNSEKDQKSVIVHELIHAISTGHIDLNDGEFFTKVGKDKHQEFYRALNEGITNALEEEISQNETEGYKDEKNVYKLLLIMLDKDTIMKKFFQDINELEYAPGKLEEIASNMFRNELIKKYGNDLGEILNQNLAEIRDLSDNLNAIHKHEKKGPLQPKEIKEKIQTERNLYEAIKKVIEQLIENEQDPAKKIDIMHKCAIIKHPTIKYDIDKVYDIYLESGRISNEPFDKRKLFKNLITKPCSYEEIGEILNMYRYYETEDGYRIRQVEGEIDALTDGLLFDKDGNLVEEQYLTPDELDKITLRRRKINH